MRNRTENQMTLALIRHGETQANKEHRYLGKTDEALSENGIKTLLSYKKQNYYPDVEYLFTSPMKRCMETAQILYPKLCPVIIPEWTEMDFGRFEYKNYEELKDDRQYKEWIDSKGVMDFPEGESRKNFILRCKRGLMRMSDKLQYIENIENIPIHVGVIAHGGTIMALLSLYDENRYFNYQVSNGRGYICRIDRWGSRVKLWEVSKI